MGDRRWRGDVLRHLDSEHLRRITISNLHVYRVISSNQPFPWAVKVKGSKDIRFRNVHCYSNSKVSYDTAGNLLVVSYAGNGTIYALEPGTPEMSPVLLTPQAAGARPGSAAILPAGDWRLQRDPSGGPLPRTHHYLAPDERTFVSATRDFVDGATSWGVKSSDLIRAFGLQIARPGERVYLTSEAEVATWSARVGDDGGLSDLRLFAHQGGEGWPPTRRAASTSRPETSTCSIRPGP